MGRSEVMPGREWQVVGGEWVMAGGWASRDGGESELVMAGAGNDVTTSNAISACVAGNAGGDGGGSEATVGRERS